MGRDSKGNHLILFEGEDGVKFAKCPKCGHYEKDATTVQWNAKKVWDADELRERLEEIGTYPIRSLEDRRVPDWVCEHYGVRVGLSPNDGQTIIEHYYPRLNNDLQIQRYNVRICDPKGFYSIGPKGMPFGLDTLYVKDCSRVKLFIFEDELSTMSGYRVLKEFAKDGFKHMHPACIGLTAGSGTIVDTLQILIDRKLLEQFEEVIYVHDNDNAGHESYKRGRSMYPNLKGVTTHLKDANDMVMAGRNKELFRTLLKGAKVRSPDGAANTREAFQDATTINPEGLCLPWPGLSELISLRWGELWSIGGGTSIGKTLLAHAMAAHYIQNYQVPVAMFMLEERIGRTLRSVATHMTGIKLNSNESFSGEILEKVIEDYNLDDLLFFWKNKGENDWDNISQCVRHYAVVYGCKLFFIDNITALTNTLAPSEQNTEIARIATEAAGLADELDITIVLFSHLNPPQSGPSHEEGGEVRPVQFSGSRALQRWSHVMLGFERNLYAEGDNKNYSKIRVLKDRENGRTGFINTKYDTKTGRLEQNDEGIPDVGNDPGPSDNDRF